MNDWIDELYTLATSGQSTVLVTLVTVRGSSPRDRGTRMIVSSDSCLGSVGGGQLEHRCTATAREMLTGEDQPRLEKFILGAPLDQCCGGTVEVLFEPVAGCVPDWLEDLHSVDLRQQKTVLATTLRAQPPAKSVHRLAAQSTAVTLTQTVEDAARDMLDEGGGSCLVEDVLVEALDVQDFNIAVFGAGHVGKALVATLAGLDADIFWIDDRDGIFTSVPTGVRTIQTTSPAREVGKMPAGSFYLVMTHSHELDFGICTAVLSRNDAAYCGLIGSNPKRRSFEKRFAEAGLDEAAIQSLVCPIGIKGISGKQPAAIAIATAAEILRVYEQLPVSHGE